MPCLMISLICRVPLIAFWGWKCWFWSDLDLKTTLLAQPGHLYKPSIAEVLKNHALPYDFIDLSSSADRFLRLEMLVLVRS